MTHKPHHLAWGLPHQAVLKVNTPSRGRRCGAGWRRRRGEAAEALHPERYMLVVQTAAPSPRGPSANRSEILLAGPRNVVFKLSDHKALVVHDFLEDIADRDDPYKFIVFVHRQVADVLVRHHRHAFL